MTRSKAIKVKCRDCADTPTAQKTCPFPDCPLFTFRKNHTRIYTPQTAIKKYCYWCSNNQRNEVKLCIDKTCVFYSYLPRAV